MARRTPAAAPGKVRSIHAYSSPVMLAKLDQRTKEARLLRELREELIQHVGGSPSAPQRVLIERVVNIQLQVTLMDRKAAEGGAMTGHDQRAYLAWCNTLGRLMRQLGMRPAAEKAPSLADFLAHHDSQRAPA